MKHRRKPVTSTVKLSGSNIEVRGTDVNGALRQLRRVLESEGWQQALSKQEYYERPGETRRKKHQAARKRWQRKQQSAWETDGVPPAQSQDKKYMKSKRKRRKRMERDTWVLENRRRNR